MIKEIQGIKSLRGELQVPGDKSISHRAVIVSSLAEGKSEIRGFLHANDPLSTISCLTALGIQCEIHNDFVTVFGKGLYGLSRPNQMLDAGNSGTTMRLLSGILSGQQFSSTLSGDQYLLQRPMQRVIEPLQRMGASISSQQNGRAPLVFHGPNSLKSIHYTLPIASAQVKSAVLLAGLYADGITSVTENISTRDHTERMLGAKVSMENGMRTSSIEGGKKLSPTQYIIPGDPSSAAFYIVASLITPHSEILIRNVSLNPTRIGFITILQKMGGNIVVEGMKEIGGEPIGDIHVRSSHLVNIPIINGEIIPNIIDEIPILAVAGAYADGEFHIRDASELRHKETDRIKALITNLRSAGLNVEELQDGLVFQSKNHLVSNDFQSFSDHRIAMAFGVAAIASPGVSRIHDAEHVDISYPAFWQQLENISFQS